MDKKNSKSEGPKEHSVCSKGHIQKLGGKTFQYKSLHNSILFHISEKTIKKGKKKKKGERRY